MKNRIFLLLLLCLAVGLGGCLKEPACPNGSADGKMQIRLLIGNMEPVETRSAASAKEREIHRLMVLIFGRDGFYRDGIITSGNLQGTNGDQQRTLTIDLAPADGDEVVILANFNESRVPFEVGKSTMADINKVMSYSAAYSPSSGLPMSGRFTFHPGGTTPICELTRSVSKIELKVAPDVVLGPSVPNFSISSWSACNVLSGASGAIFSESSVNCTLRPGALSYTEFLSGISLGFCYVPEYPAATLAKGQAVLDTQFHKDRYSLGITASVGGLQRYYRIELFDPQTGKYIDVRRNTHITVTITKVKLEGYLSWNEAAAMPGSNLEYEIKVESGDDNVIVSNGQYALSLECDELVYTGNPALEVSLGQVRAIDASGAGLPATKTITGSGVVLTGATTISTTPQELKAKMSGTSGTITLRLGNIERVIKLTRLDDAIPASGGAITLQGDYTNVTWIKQASTLHVTPNGTTSLTFSAAENVTPTNASSLSSPAVVPVFETQSAEGVVMRGGANPGRTRISIIQGAPECVGWFGGAPDNSGDRRYSKRLLLDSHDAPTELRCYTSISSLSQDDIETGLENTKTLMAQSNPQDYQAAYYCYMRNDRNGNGLIDADESVDWYLPAQNQLMAVWTAGLNMSVGSGDYYWVSSIGKNRGQGKVLSFRIGGNVTAHNQTNLHRVRCCKDF